MNPTDPSLSHAISSYDIKHNFVVSYDYHLPIDQIAAPNRWTKGWAISGITHLSTGFPITMVSNGDNSLLGTNPNGVNNSSIDEPDYNGASLRLNRNPRKDGNIYFATSDECAGHSGHCKAALFLWSGR